MALPAVPVSHLHASPARSAGIFVATTPAHRLGRALSRFRLSSGLGAAASPAVLMALFAVGPGPGTADGARSVIDRAPS
ncbi:hypothetical protein [Embleya sp. MST-111070]|uniref:hypothetical protein n=1 Tax=Embleya sp. MST-111070 TaxID=3398231 RepID=UPI003F73624D